jgi:Fic family protein
MAQVQHHPHPCHFEPLLPQSRLDTLRARARKVVALSYRLSRAVHPSTVASLRELLREMNSYYSNRIEGQSPHPMSIARALRNEFSDKPSEAHLQRIALAHIEAEAALEARVAAGVNPLRSDFLREAHESLYRRLSEEDRQTEDGRIVQPGELRAEQVAVGQHEPPPSVRIPVFLQRMDEVYGAPHSLEDTLIAIAAAHHRAAWVHPFSDGNGRSVRLQSHCALWPLSAGLWSVNRGLARARDQYYARLNDADSPQPMDIDGQGNLSEEALCSWCSWFLQVCEEQVEFMTQMLDLGGMRQRIEALVMFRASRDRGIRTEAALPLYHLFLAGPISRADFKQMTGLGDKVAQTLLSNLLASGLVTSKSHRSPVQLAFPLNALQCLFRISTLRRLPGTLEKTAALPQLGPSEISLKDGDKYEKNSRISG